MGNLSTATYKETLKNYAYGVAQDVNSSLADFIAPRVPVGVGTGMFKKFDDKNAFQIYDTSRAVGGAANRIEFVATDGTFNCGANALEIAIDDQERMKAGGSDAQLEEAKTRALVISACLAREKKVIDAMSAASAGTKVTFTAAAITKLPDLVLSPVKTAFGGMEFTALVPNGKLPDDETTKFYTVAAQAYADGEAPRTNLSGFHYTGTLGTGQSALSIPDTKDGWTVSFAPKLEPVTTDSQGTIDYLLTGIDVTAKCTPLGLTEAQILGALPVLRGRGASMAGAGDLVISATGGLTVTLKHATVVTGPLNWGATALRAGEIGFTAHIDTTNGALFDVALAAAQGN